MRSYKKVGGWVGSAKLESDPLGMVAIFSVRGRSFAVLALLAQALLCASAVVGQSVLGGIHGVTRKPDGSPLSQAQVTLRNFEGTTERLVVSGDDGTFAMENLAPGRYELEATKPGFANSRVVSVELAPGEELNEELKLGKKAKHAHARKKN